MKMLIELQSDQSGEVFSKQLLDIDNGKKPVVSSSRFLPIFVTILKLRPNSSRSYSQTLFKITRIIYG
jgi:hypothetical protein